VTKPTKSREEEHSRVISAEGVQWKVFEHEKLGRTLERTLVFSPAEGAVRRLHKFPQNWRTLDDTTLFALTQKKGG
jgi:hypothetical protein